MFLVLRSTHLFQFPQKYISVDFHSNLYSYFCAEFPSGCHQFQGPHSISCYENIWLDVGCLPQGLSWPDDLTLSEITYLNDFDLR